MLKNSIFKIKEIIYNTNIIRVAALADYVLRKSNVNP